MSATHSPSPRRCPLCAGASRHALEALDRNRASTSTRFQYHRCLRCRTLFMVDVPPDLSRSYVSNYHDFGADGQPRWKSNSGIERYEAARAQLVRRHSGPGTLIDIGAGPGSFACAAQRAGFVVTAIEMDPGCCRYLRHGLGLTAICSDRPELALRQVPPARAITLWHVLEHLTDPAEMLAAAAARLQPDGVIALGLPNPDSLQFRMLGARWPHLDAPRHVCLIPAPALIAHAARHGLRCVEATTDDPFGRAAGVHGWTYALHRHPAQSAPSSVISRAGQLIDLALAPIERRRNRGAAYTLVFRQEGAQSGRLAG